MSKKDLNFKVDLTQSEALILCLALGTIEAMRSGAWSLDAGIWTLGRPVFWKPLKRSGMAKEVLDVFRQADELASIEKLVGREQADALLDQMYATIRKHLSSLPDKSWYLNLHDVDSN